MINLVAVKAMAGINYIRADQVMAIAMSEPTKCTIYLAGGVTIPCSEAAKDVIAKLQAATAERPVEMPEETK
jgi:hypothetical protein